MAHRVKPPGFTREKTIAPLRLPVLKHGCSANYEGSRATGGRRRSVRAALLIARGIALKGGERQFIVDGYKGEKEAYCASQRLCFMAVQFERNRHGSCRGLRQCQALGMKFRYGFRASAFKGIFAHTIDLTNRLLMDNLTFAARKLSDCCRGRLLVEIGGRVVENRLIPAQSQFRQYVGGAIARSQ